MLLYFLFSISSLLLFFFLILFLPFIFPSFQVTPHFFSSSDSRNHSHCCLNSLSTVTTQCQFLCQAKSASDLKSNKQLWPCMQGIEFKAIRRCFAAGLALLPSAPRLLQLLEIVADTAKVHWKPPTRLPVELKGYELTVRTDKNETTVRLNSLLL